MIDLLTIAPIGVSLIADAIQAITTVRDYIRPIIQLLAGLASIASVLLLMYGGIIYMTSRGQPEKLASAKHIIKNTLIGLVIVLGAVTITTLLTGAMGATSPSATSSLPILQPIEPKEAGNAFVEVVIKTIVGFLNTIIQAVASPFLNALTFFTVSTPLMSENPSVFSLWLVMVAIANILFVAVVALIGLHIMSASTFGLNEIEFKHLLPRLGLIFLLVNVSIFLIDGIILLSNVLILAISQAGGGATVWSTLTAVVDNATGESVAALMLMFVFLIFSVILLVYYVGRLVTLFIGAVLSPLVILVWLIPGFRDFSETAMKTYLSTVFVLFVHVVILLLAASLFAGMSATVGGNAPNALIAMVAGLATIIALLKTQGVMTQFSYVSLGSRSMRQLGSQFMNGVSYLGGRSRATAATLSGTTNKTGPLSISGRGSSSSHFIQPTGVSSRATSNSSGAPPQIGVTRVPEGSHRNPDIKAKSSKPIIDSRPLVSERTLLDDKHDTHTTIRKEDYLP